MNTVPEPIVKATFGLNFNRGLQLYDESLVPHIVRSWIGRGLSFIEAWLSIEMMHDKKFAPNLNLENRDERCGDLDYVTGAFREIDATYVMSNNFAFGGVNTSLIFKRPD